MKTRILAALIMLPLLIFVYLGGKPLIAACFAVTILAMHEFFSGFKAIDIKPSVPIGCVSVLLLYAIDLLPEAAPGYSFLSAVGLSGTHAILYLFWIVVSIALSLIYLFRMDGRRLEDSLATMVGIFYIAFFIHFVVLVDKSGATSWMRWLIFSCTIGSDSLAYLTGVALGKHKLCPKISPKKTIEGSIGGLLGSVTLCILSGAIFAPMPLSAAGGRILKHCIAVGLLGGAVSQLGDLAASAFKRKMGIKDYGNLIPGHGGVLDRFDSALFVAPFVYFYIAFVCGDTASVILQGFGV